ncbi:hypothetical protein D1007_38510 [Hordeum vulgare]|nr:hypothetical protein D1007_38510 [Hordeum vulgare]
MASAVAPHGRPQPGQQTLLRPRSLRLLRRLLPRRHGRPRRLPPPSRDDDPQEDHALPDGRRLPSPQEMVQRPRTKRRSLGRRHPRRPPAAGLEGLRIAAKEQNQCDEMYSPPLGSLSFAATLRVLVLEHCNLKTPPPSARLAFPCLTDLTLRHCFALEGNLQDLVDDAPALTSLALVNLRQMSSEPPGSKKKTIYMHEAFNLRLRLRSSTVSVAEESCHE